MYVVYQVRCIFHYTKCMAGVQFFLSRELPRTAEQISAILIIRVSNFISLLKGAAERNDSEQLHQYGVLEYFTLPRFYHKLSCFAEVCTTLRPLLLFSMALQLLVQSSGLLNHFLPSSPILDNLVLLTSVYLF